MGEIARISEGRKGGVRVIVKEYKINDSKKGNREISRVITHA